MTAKRTISRILGIFISILFVFNLGLEAEAQGGPPPGKGRPGVEFDTEKSPLQKAIESSVRGKKDKALEAEEELEHPACAAAIRTDNEANMAKHCKFPKLNTKKVEKGPQCPDCGDRLNANGKVTGKKIKTETVLEYKNPGQRTRNGKSTPKERWDPVKLQRSEKGHVQQGNGAFNSGGQGSVNGMRTKTSVFFPGSAVNDDQDCFDTLTGEHLTDCFDGDPASGNLLQTLTPNAGGCVHNDGTQLFGSDTDGEEDDCYQADNTLKTTLMEAIDEDGPDLIDNDLDG